MNLSNWKYVAAILLLAGVQQAHAAGTTQGTSIANTATVDYTVGGVNQPDVSSNTATFVVDRRINLTVAEVGNAYTDVAAGATAQVLTFTVTNSTNGTQDFRFITTNDTTGATDPFGGTDDFDPTAIQVFVDSNNNGVYDAGVDIIAVPKTMDNDVQGTEYCIGFSTAITRAKDAINPQRTTIGSHEGIGVFRIFGRDAGFTGL